MRALLVLAPGLLALGACVSAPPQTVELSDIVLQQVEFVEAAHRDLARAYFDQLEERVNDFIDNQWVPGFLERAMDNADVQQALTQIRLGNYVDVAQLESVLLRAGGYSVTEVNLIAASLQSASAEERVQLSGFVSDFTGAAMQEINAIRAEWRTQLRDSERQLMSALDESYGALKSGHLQIRSQLESVAKVTLLQDQIADKMGLLAARNRALDSVVDFSESLVNGSTTLDELVRELQREGVTRSDQPTLEGLVLDRILRNVDVDDGATLSDSELNRTLRDLENQEK